MEKVKKICVSDCGNLEYYPSAIELLEFLRKFFVDAEISFMCHRNDVIDAFDIREYLEKIQIDIKNIANSDEGFEVYNDCDLHIGFRVHAHIYCLSERKLSILVEEDGRGAGVNDALGLPNICAYKWAINKTGFCKVENDKLNYQVEDYIFNLAQNDNVMIELAYERMNRAYQEMEKHILSIRELVRELIKLLQKYKKIFI